MSLPIAVSMGDPAGIGLEIAAKAWAGGAQPAFFVIGDASAVARAGARAGIVASVQAIAAPSEAEAAFSEALPVLHRPLAREEIPARPDPANAQSILDSIAEGVALCRAHAAAALVTLPIAKAPLYEAGFAHPGHTEFLGVLCADAGLPKAAPLMMLAVPGLRVALASVHIPLAAAAGALTTAKLIDIARLLDAALQSDFAIASPRIAVAGLNPHAGESGAIGREELEIIAPAVAALRAHGLNVSGPAPADTLFHPAARERYDAVLCMYHDQGLIPLKMLDFWGGVNITLGLPIVRTSPDHGVAYDIAGTGVARADSFLSALRTAHSLAEQRRR
jgi:4-hydroxythreonine-4-phosphate dehydrogenase